MRLFYIVFITNPHTGRVKNFNSYTQKRGELAENLACRYLERKGYKILERNYSRRCGEVDIIAEKQNITHFIEVKSVSRENRMLRPEEMVDSRKLLKLSKTICSYVSEHTVNVWQFDVFCLILDHRLKKATLARLEDLILTEG